MKISAIIITLNEEATLPGCLKTLKWVDEIIVVDANSKDKTAKIAKKHGAKVVAIPQGASYSDSRNKGLKTATGDWLLYIDADERVSPRLRQEIQSVLKSKSNINSYHLPRKNIILGRWVKHGGYWPDYVHRLLNKKALIKWAGLLHEAPVIKGQVGQLKNPLLHYSVRSINQAFKKSSHWSQIEAQLLFQAQARPVNCLKIIKAFVFKLIEILIFKKGILDGTRGLILAYIQASHQASILVNLWQLQHKNKA
jgi:glycosyltransferase involved in cell wall biosynthesis